MTSRSFCVKHRDRLVQAARRTFLRKGTRDFGSLVLALGLLFLTGCRPAEQSLSAVTHLRLAGSQAQSAGGETRPAISLSSGHSLLWPVPVGPERRLRLAYCWKPPLDSETRGSLQLTLFLPGAESSPIYTGSIHLRDPRHSGRVWRTAELSIPQTPRPASLRLELLERPGPGVLPALLLAEPTLSPRSGRSPRVVILFDIDTLRRDHVSLYGYSLPTTPHIDTFFSNGLIAENCVSNSEWTLPSHATLFTSTLPNRHGTGDYNSSLPDSLPTLAESMAQAGYRTLAVTNGGYVDPVFGFARGFDLYCVTDSNVEPVEAEVRRALSWIDFYRGEPIFLFFHTYQVHDYAPTRKAALELLGSLGELGPNWNSRDLLGKGGSFQNLQLWSRNRYDTALRAVDDAFQQLMSGLEERGLIASTGVVVTSDHGEEIFDRPGPTGGSLGLGHTHPFLYEEYLAVPMLMKFPWLKAPPERITNNLSLVDLAPTLLDAVGAPRPATFEGLSFLSRASEGRQRDRVIVSEASRYDSLAARRGFRKVILRPGYSIRSWEDGTPFGTLASEECFDLEADRFERSPLPCAHQAWATDLRARAEEYIQNEFPGSLLIRFPPSATPGARTYAVRVRGHDRPPSVLSFGMDPAEKLWSQRDAITVQFRVGAAPVWVAVRPAQKGGAIQVETFGLSAFHIPGQRGPVRSGTFPWAELLMRSRPPTSEEASVFSTEPAPLISSAKGKTIPLSVIARLRSLGYISAGEWVRQEVTDERSESVTRIPSPLELPDGNVRIQTKKELPTRPIPQPVHKT